VDVDKVGDNFLDSLQPGDFKPQVLRKNRGGGGPAGPGQHKATGGAGGGGGAGQLLDVDGGPAEHPFSRDGLQKLVEGSMKALMAEMGRMGAHLHKAGHAERGEEIMRNALKSQFLDISAGPLSGTAGAAASSSSSANALLSGISSSSSNAKTAQHHHYPRPRLTSFTAAAGECGGVGGSCGRQKLNRSPFLHSFPPALPKVLRGGGGFPDSFGRNGRTGAHSRPLSSFPAIASSEKTIASEPEMSKLEGDDTRAHVSPG